MENDLVCRAVAIDLRFRHDLSGRLPLAPLGKPEILPDAGGSIRGGSFRA